MKKFEAVSLALFLMTLSIQNAASIELEDLVGQESAALLRSGESVKKVQLKAPKIALAPKGQAGSALSESVAEFKPSLLVESLFYHKKPMERSGRSWEEAERIALFNSIRALSTLSGIEYYSASRKRMRTFYESSYVVANAESREPLADPEISAVPVRSSLYAIQKDLTFGENLYRYNFSTDSDSFTFTQENLSAMNYGIIPILGKERLKTIVLIADLDDGLLVYAVSAAKATLLPGIEGKVRDSFSNRADAIFGWFKLRADKAFK